jgi:hypothetical protein
LVPEINGGADLISLYPSLSAIVNDRMFDEREDGILLRNASSDPAEQLRSILLHSGKHMREERIGFLSAGE